MTPKLHVSEDCDTKELLIQDISELGGGVITKAIINIAQIGLSKELDGTTNPRLQDFLNPILNSKVAVPLSFPDMYTVEYILLEEYSTNISVGSNIINRQSVYQDFEGIDFFYADRLYTIDKKLSTAESLWLDGPIKRESIKYYKAWKTTKLFAYTCPLQLELVKRILEYEECTDCGYEIGENIATSQHLLLALKAGDVHEYHKQQIRILEKLRQRLGITECSHI